MSMRRASCLAFAALAGASTAGCFVEEDGVLCTLKGAPDGARLTAIVSPESTAASGVYQVTIEAEGEQLSWSATYLPSAMTCDSPCSPEGDRIAFSFLWASATEVDVFVRFAAAAPGGPSEITMTVSGEAGTGSALVRPVYAESEQNGPGCGVTTDAHESFVVDLVAE
jgi:hypothetical protein